MANKTAAPAIKADTASSNCFLDMKAESERLASQDQRGLLIARTP